MEFFATSGVTFEMQLWHLRKKKIQCDHMLILRDFLQKV